MPMNSADEKPRFTSQGDSVQKPNSSLTRKLSTRWHLPVGWERYFQVRGNGMVIQCPICRAAGIIWKPGKEVDPWQRWKVLTNHIAVEHSPNLRPATQPAKLQRIK